MVFDGKKIPLQRPRVRTRKGQEVELQSYGHLQQDGKLQRAVRERMVAGLSTRNYRRAVETMPGELDRELLKRFVEGDQDAFESLFRLFEAEVYRWVMRIVRDSGIAEDVLVEAFWRAYRGRAHFDPFRSFGAWMRRIATNSACDHLRMMRPRASWITITDGIEGPKSADHVQGESIALAFRKLPPKLQLVATLALIEGQSHAEIAEVLESARRHG